MLGAEQHDLGHHIIEIGRPERARKAHARLFIVADAHEVDVAGAIDLAAGQKEYVDAALARTVEQLAPAIGEEVVLAALEQRHIGHSATARLRKQCRHGGNRRGIADCDVTHVADHARDHVGEEFLVADGRGVDIHAARRTWTYSSRYRANPSSVAARRAYSLRCATSAP